jgi:enoyl-CoA hydratase
MADADLVQLTEDGPIATITINRPDKLNALDLGVLGALHDAIEQVRAWGRTRCAILTGAGDKAFVAGADIGEMQGFDEEQARKFSDEGHAVLANLESLDVPVIAAVNGFALGGGCELALACDFIHASSKAKFGQPEVKLGVIPGFGGTQRLARRVGIARARELVYSGAMIGAEEAERIGLVNGVHAPEALMEHVTKLATTIASMGPYAVAQAKRVLLEGEEKPLAEANRLEAEAFARCFTTTDQTEGMSAFLEKRKPTFAGK